MAFVVGLLGSLLVSLAISELFAASTKLEDARPADSGDYNFPTATEDRAVPLLFGTARFDAPNVIWYGDKSIQPIKVKVKVSLLQKKKQVVGYRYLVGFHTAWCSGPIDEVKRIWVKEDVFVDTSDPAKSGSPVVEAGDPADAGGVITQNRKRFFSEPNFLGGDEEGNGGLAGQIDFEFGELDQEKNEYLDGKLTPFAPAYRSTFCTVQRAFYIGNQPSVAQWQLEARRTPAFDWLSDPADAIVNGADANPACCVYEAIVNADWGWGLPIVDVDEANFAAVASLLKTEGNGFSIIWDTQNLVGDFMAELERQMDGALVQDPLTGKFKINLARADYTVGLLPEINDTNLDSVISHDEGTYEDTVAQIRIPFEDRARDYYKTSAQDHNLSNQLVVRGLFQYEEVRYPGVKDATLAAKLATRDLKAKSRPLRKAKLAVDRSFMLTEPADVIRWTNEDLGITDLPMRVGTVSIGNDKANTVVLTLMEDVFAFDEATLAAPGPSNFDLPILEVAPTPAADVLLFEMPRAMGRLDVDNSNPLDRVWAAVRQQANASSVSLYQRHDPSAPPSGDFTLDEEITGTARVARLQSAIDASTPLGGSIVLEADLDTLVDFADSLQLVSLGDVGQLLLNVFYIDGEFIGCTGFSQGGSTVTLTGVYRGLLGTAPRSHNAATQVWLPEGVPTATAFPQNGQVEVQFRPRSIDEEVAEGLSNTFPVPPLVLDDRARRPYPPAEMLLNGTRFDPTVSLDAGTPEGVIVSFTRKDFRTLDEIQSILQDDFAAVPSTLDDFTTRYTVSFYEEPNTLLLQDSGLSGPTPPVFTRARILRATAGTIPAALRVEILTSHVYEGTSYDADEPLQWSFTPTSAQLSGLVNLGNLDENVYSTTVSAPETGTYTFTLDEALATGVIEARINGGADTAVISAGLTTGTLVGVTAGDTIELRHTEAGADTDQTIVVVDAPSTAGVAYAVLVL